MSIKQCLLIIALLYLTCGRAAGQELKFNATKVLDFQAGIVHQVLYSGQGKYVALVTTHHTLILLNADFEEVWAYHLPDLPLNCVWQVAFTPTEDKLVIANYQKLGEVALIAIAERRVLWQGETTDKLIQAVLFTQNTQQLLTAGEELSIRVWQLNDTYLTLSQTLDINKTNLQEVLDLEESPEGSIVVAVGIGAENIVLQHKRNEWRIDRSFTQPTYTYAAVFAPQGDYYLIAGESEISIFIFGRRNWEKLGLPEVQNEVISQIAFHPTGRFVAITYPHGAKIFQFKEGTLKEYEVLTSLGGKSIALTFSPDGTYLLTATTSGKVQIWEME
jgi:WD40 repeat protein